MNRKYFRFALLLSLLASLAVPVNAQLLPGAGSSFLDRGDRPRPLPIEQAFPFFISVVDSDTLDVTWQIAPEHYLYRHRFQFALQLPGDDQRLPIAFRLPDGIAKSDPFFGDIEAYYDTVTARLTTGPAVPPGAQLIIEYQGCAEWGFCYPPQLSAQPVSP